MGLFDNLFGSHERELTVHESFAGVLVAATASDGHISSEEAQGLVTILQRMTMFENWSDERFGNMLDRLLATIKRQGVDDALQKFTQGLPQELKETVFANACDLVLADGIVEEEEKEYLNNLQRLLQISGDQAITIVQVMVIKNRG